MIDNTQQDKSNAKISLRYKQPTADWPLGPTTTLQAP